VILDFFYFASSHLTAKRNNAKGGFKLISVILSLVLTREFIFDDGERRGGIFICRQGFYCKPQWKKRPFYF